MQSSLLLTMFNRDSDLLIPAPTAPCMAKDSSSSPLYFQPPGLGIIQLVEVPAPPRARPSSSFASSSFASSSSFVSSSSDASDEKESIASSSYCSSAGEEFAVSYADDTYNTRVSRVLAWRESSAKVDTVSTLPHSAPVPAVPLKRKVDADDSVFEDDSDMASQSSKRSRASTSQLLVPWPGWSKRRYSEHSCPACDADFLCRSGLQQHGRDPTLPDACREAVQYGFEA